MKISRQPAWMPKEPMTQQKTRERGQANRHEEHSQKETAKTKETLMKETRNKKVAYGKPSGTRDETTIQRLREESEQAYRQLREIVAQLMERQGSQALRFEEAEAMVEKSPEKVKIDEEARSELEELLGPEGPYGVEQTSDRIVEYAIALSGGDTEKAELLREAIKKGFEAAEQTLGSLPEISRQTYDRIMEKLDEWVDGESTS